MTTVAPTKGLNNFDATIIIFLLLGPLPRPPALPTCIFSTLHFTEIMAKDKKEKKVKIVEPVEDAEMEDVEIVDGEASKVCILCPPLLSSPGLYESTSDKRMD
jgi:hypothetical protein